MKIMKKVVKGPRITVTVSIDLESFQGVKVFCDKTGQDFSGLVDLYVQSIYRTMKAAGLDKKEDVSRLDLMKFAIMGLKENP